VVFEIKIVPGCWGDRRAFVSRWHCSFALLVGPIALISHVLSPRLAHTAVRP